MQNNQYASPGGRTLSSTSRGFKSHVDAESKDDEQLGVAQPLRQRRLYSACAKSFVVIRKKEVSCPPNSFQNRPHGNSYAILNE